MTFGRCCIRRARKCGYDDLNILSFPYQIKREGFEGQNHCVVLICFTKFIRMGRSAAVNFPTAPIMDEKSPCEYLLSPPNLKNVVNSNFSNSILASYNARPTGPVLTVFTKYCVSNPSAILDLWKSPYIGCFSIKEISSNFDYCFIYPLLYLALLMHALLFEFDRVLYIAPSRFVRVLRCYFPCFLFFITDSMHGRVDTNCDFNIQFLLSFEFRPLIGSHLFSRSLRTVPGGATMDIFFNSGLSNHVVTKYSRCPLFLILLPFAV